MKKNTSFTEVIIHCVLFADNNECDQGTDGCEQQCYNDPGDFHCDCEQGYQLAQDGLTCIGTSSTFAI